MNGTTTIAEFRDAVLDPAKRAHYRLAWLSTVDHKRIAVLYMLTGLVFFIIGGVEALFSRLVLLCTFERDALFLISWGRLLGSRSLRPGNRLNKFCHQHHRDSYFAARSRNDDASASALYLDQLC